MAVKRASDAGEGMGGGDLPPLDGGLDGGVPQPLWDVGSASSTPPSSLTGGIKFGKQAAKGTALATGYTIARSVQSASKPVYDLTQNADEHYYGANPRATVNKGTLRRVAYMVQWAMRAHLHPSVIGNLLLMAGYAVTTTGASAPYTHTFKLAQRSALGWGSIVHRIGEGAPALERKITDARAAAVSVSGAAGGLVVAANGVGIKEELAAGTETGVLEPDALLLPSAGALAALSINGENFLSPVRGVEISHVQGLDPSEMALWSDVRSDIPQTAVDWAVVLRGIDMTADAYKVLEYETTAGTGPSRVCPDGVLKFSFASASNIPTCEVPYSLEWDAKKVQWTMGNFANSGRDLVRFDLSARLIDADPAADPIIIKLVNDKASY